MDVGTRSRIVGAALQLAAGEGWESTSMQSVRRRAGVSNGTLFHHFPSRSDLAAAVVGAAMAEHQTALLRELGSSAEQGVRAVVLLHLRWVAENPQLARLLLSAPPDVLRAALAADDVAANRRFFADAAAWLRSHGWSGDPAVAVVAALWLGAAQYYARGWLAAPDDSLPAVAATLADGAWRALQPLLHREEPE